MMINGLWNRRCGPGGGTRRLHQEAREGSNPNQAFMGTKQDRRA